MTRSPHVLLYMPLLGTLICAQLLRVCPVRERGAVTTMFPQRTMHAWDALKVRRPCLHSDNACLGRTEGVTTMSAQRTMFARDALKVWRSCLHSVQCLLGTH